MQSFLHKFPHFYNVAYLVYLVMKCCIVKFIHEEKFIKNDILSNHTFNFHKY